MKKTKTAGIVQPSEPVTTATSDTKLEVTSPTTSSKDVVVVSEPKDESVMQTLLAKVEELERKDKENQAQLKMLVEVADKGRVYNYEASKSKGEKKPFKVKLSVFGGGIIVGWRTSKDELIKHPTTGMIVGEQQEYELLILDAESNIQKVMVSGYPTFSNARYNDRVECEVISKSDDFNGNTTFEVQTPDGRIIKIASAFVN